ncbi:anchored repeat-type ABC transporter ATP-binding subunit [Amycolatopsis jiangsuensis]|uniref:Manganese/iron transport system ATP-binding protein n=1 Tax=Amycolatopsis jiangsuensis TaxID=1181879 RepID=A0A840J757_9PSEU|nr:anchored repeat-type ABC transporter ATP-binding subunit [Amycolatopsis jiangsuensis]MBB4689254.1 manganese/iron transport system ATP-binding protein [Amycolatopsis jiangsuensis]
MAERQLELSGVAVELGGRQVLHDVDLKLDESELVGLIGPNGAGKTTLLRTILALQPVRSGTLRVGGRPPAQARGRVGYVPQRHEFAWDFPISVEAAVLTGRAHLRRWGRRADSEDRETVRDALRRVGMADLASRPVGELSGGQRQRVLVARALAMRPRLLLLDEPFTGIDVPTQEALTDLLSQLRTEGTALLMTTHDLAAAAGMCTRLCLLNRTVVADDEPARLADADVWLRAFGLARSEQLLRILGGAT